MSNRGVTAERISERGIARSLKVGRNTIASMRKKNAERIASWIEASGGQVVGE